MPPDFARLSGLYRAPPRRDVLPLHQRRGLRGWERLLRPGEGRLPLHLCFGTPTFRTPTRKSIQGRRWPSRRASPSPNLDRLERKVRATRRVSPKAKARKAKLRARAKPILRAHLSELSTAPVRAPAMVGANRRKVNDAARKSSRCPPAGATSFVGPVGEACPLGGWQTLRAFASYRNIPPRF